MRTIIYGASDDLIEIDGAINDETDSYNTKSKITASDGTVAYIEYAPGCAAVWSITIKKRGSLFERVLIGCDEAEADHWLYVDVIDICTSVPSYSDVLIFKPGLEWVKINSQKFRPA